MRFGTYFAYWENEWDADYLQYCKKVSALGFDVLEVSGAGIYSMNEEELKELRREAERYGLKLTACIGLTKDNDVSSEDEKVRANGTAFVKRLLDHMHIARIDRLSGITYSYWPFDYSQKFDKPVMRAYAIQSVREMADYAAQYDIILNLEVVNRFEHPLLNCAAEAVGFVEEVDRPNVKILLDTFHMNIEEDTFRDAILCAGPYLGHVHIGEANRKVPGKGHIAWDEIGEALCRIGYDECVVMEPFVKEGGKVGLDIRVWRDLSDDADEAKLDSDIADSLVFVKKVFGDK